MRHNIKIQMLKLVEYKVVYLHTYIIYKFRFYCEITKSISHRNIEHFNNDVSGLILRCQRLTKYRNLEWERSTKEGVRVE
jgi:hypothetical protein